MARFTTGNTFSTSDQVTAAKLNNAVNNAALSADSVDDSTIELSSNALRIKDIGVTTAKIADDAIIASKIAAGALTDAVYPIGSIFITVTNYADSAAVVNAIGGTTWASFGAGRVLVGQNSSDSDFNSAEEEGGSKTKALEFANMPAHSHQWYDLGGSSGRNIDGTNFTSSRSWNSSGNFSNINDPLDDNDFYTNTATNRNSNGSSFSIVQPYIVVYMWKRTA